MIYQGGNKDKTLYIITDVWLGSRVYRKGCFVGDGAVVAKIISDYAIVVDN